VGTKGGRIGNGGKRGQAGQRKKTRLSVGRDETLGTGEVGGGQRQKVGGGTSGEFTWVGFRKGGN